MSGIVGSYFNTRGSGVVAKLGTDGQVFTSTGAGLSQGFEAAAGGGKIGQVVQATKTDTASVSGTSYADLGFSAAITPVASSSKIFVLFNMMLSTVTGERGGVKLVRDSTDLLIGDAAGDRARSTHMIVSATTTNCIPTVVSYLDSPSTTSETTYKIQCFGEGNAFNINANNADSDSASHSRGASSVILMEVLA